MAGAAPVLVEIAAAVLARALARAGVNVLGGGAVVVGAAGLPGDTQKDDSKATPVPRSAAAYRRAMQEVPPGYGLPGEHTSWYVACRS